MNTITNGTELPDNTKMLYCKREKTTHEGKVYELVIKASKEPLFEARGTKAFTAVQVLDENKKEIQSEFYPQIIPEEQAEKMMENLKSKLVVFIAE